MKDRMKCDQYRGDDQVMAQTSLNFILRLNEMPLEGFKNGCDMVSFAFNNIILAALGIMDSVWPEW